jgi:Ca2+-binding RTX toxin-like protein
VLVGGLGSDTASYEDNWGAVFVNLRSGQGFGNAAQGDTYQSIENLTGGLFGDFFIGDDNANRIDGGGGDDILLGGLGGDTLIGGTGTNTASYEDNWGAVFVNLSTGQGFNNAAQGDTYQQIQNLQGGIFDDFFIGDANANRLAGGSGNDTLIGAGGADTFVFDTALGAGVLGTGNVDAINDFVSGTDRIALDDAVFSGIGSLGALNANAFFTGTAAHDADDRIIYNSTTGQIFFDADGNGAGVAVLFSTLQGASLISSSDFQVI